MNLFRDGFFLGKPIEYWIELDAMGAAFGLEKAIRERDEARQVAMQLLRLLLIEREPDIGDLGMFTQRLREDWWRRKQAVLASMSPALRRLVEE
jgi:hypothetical protein